jgi:hypothetical protein
LESHNRFYSPADLAKIKDKLVFCEENQVVVFWGYDHNQRSCADPPVYQGVNGDEIEWYLESERMSEFLIGMIYWQAVWGGLPHLRSTIANELPRRVVETWPLVWKDDDSQIFSSGSSVLCLTPQEDGVLIEGGALLEQDLDNVWHAFGL